MGGFSTVTGGITRRARVDLRPEGLIYTPGFYPPEKVTITGYDIYGNELLGADQYIKFSWTENIILGGKGKPFSQPDYSISIPYIGSNPNIAWRTGVKFLDAHIRANVYPDNVGVTLRYQGGNGQCYIARIYTVGAGFELRLYNGGLFSILAYESASLTSGWYDLVLSIAGSTLKASRDGGSTFPVTATNTAITTEGYAGGHCWYSPECNMKPPASIGAPLSAPPKPIAYFEVEIIGSGSPEDPFRASLPEDIRDGINVLAVTNSALIKTGPDGKPVEYRAIVRIFDQPDRPANLLPISQVLDVLRNTPGVRELTREQAIAMAKRLDDMLHDLDLRSDRELGLDRRQAAKNYMSWRINNLGVREELLDLEVQERYAEEDKGW